jgi:nitrogen fixation protein FixH
MNWGWKITIVYLLFAGGIMTLVMKSRAHKVDLVVPDYYQQELAYETRLNAMRNVEAMSTKPVISCDGQEVKIVYPAQMNASNCTGSVVMYRPSDLHDDRKTELSIGQNQEQVINTSDMKKGLYMLQLSWNSENKDFYTEQTIFLK